MNTAYFHKNTDFAAGRSVLSAVSSAFRGEVPAFFVLLCGGFTDGAPALSLFSRDNPLIRSLC